MDSILLRTAVSQATAHDEIAQAACLLEVND
jgi:hypothetical protein